MRNIQVVIAVGMVQAVRTVWAAVALAAFGGCSLLVDSKLDDRNNDSTDAGSTGREAGQQVDLGDPAADGRVVPPKEAGPPPSGSCPVPSQVLAVRPLDRKGSFDLVVDRAGKPMAAYVEEGSDNLVRAWWNDAQHRFEYDRNLSTGGSASDGRVGSVALARSGSGETHLFFTQPSAGHTLSHATWNGPQVNQVASPYGKLSDVAEIAAAGGGDRVFVVGTAAGGGAGTANNTVWFVQAKTQPAGTAPVFDICSEQRVNPQSEPRISAHTDGGRVMVSTFGHAGTGQGFWNVKSAKPENYCAAPGISLSAFNQAPAAVALDALDAQHLAYVEAGGGSNDGPAVGSLFYHATPAGQQLGAGQQVPLPHPTVITDTVTLVMDSARLEPYIIFTRMSPTGDQATLSWAHPSEQGWSSGPIENNCIWINRGVVDDDDRLHLLYLRFPSCNGEGGSEPSNPELVYRCFELDAL